MNPNPDSRERELERLVHRALHELPARRAPRSLEQRVLAEISRRVDLPWWRQSFVHWPWPARGAFLLASFALVAMVILGAAAGVGGIDGSALQVVFAQPIAWWESGRAVFDALNGFVGIMLRNIPPIWLYGGLAFIAAVYAMLFGLGAAAYRVLQPHVSVDR
ncbi:MAG: hypothetical protein HZC55_24330 [Verrucomicrobia bacterium]|nr:hypothetical protein [Verrucomicrobiota bacterium]